MKHPKLVKALVFVGMIALVVLIIYVGMRVAFPSLLEAIKSGNHEELEAFLQQGKASKTLILLAILQFVQILSIVLPSPPIHIAGGMVAGTLYAFVTCHIAYCLANLTVFILARKFHGRLEKFGLGSDGKGNKLDEWLASGEPWIVVVLACMIPLVPNGLIPYAAAQTNMKAGKFTWSVFVGGFVPTFLLCAIGSNIMQADYPLILLLVSIDIICMWEVYNHKDKLEALMAKAAALRGARRTVKKKEREEKRQRAENAGKNMSDGIVPNERGVD